jgi:hypothetical protein
LSRAIALLGLQSFAVQQLEERWDYGKISPGGSHWMAHCRNWPASEKAYSLEQTLLVHCFRHYHGGFTFLSILGDWVKYPGAATFSRKLSL